MPTRDIAREDWADFFNHFSRTRQGRRVLIEAVDPASPQVEARSLPLVGITFEEKGSGAGAIEIMAGIEQDDHFTHTVRNPKHVYHKTEKGPASDEIDHDEVLEITADDAPPITYVRFQRPVGGA